MASAQTDNSRRALDGDVYQQTRESPRSVEGEVSTVFAGPATSTVYRPAELLDTRVHVGPESLRPKLGGADTVFDRSTGEGSIAHRLPPDLRPAAADDDPPEEESGGANGTDVHVGSSGGPLLDQLARAHTKGEWTNRTERRDALALATTNEWSTYRGLALKTYTNVSVSVGSKVTRDDTLLGQRSAGTAGPTAPNWWTEETLDLHTRDLRLREAERSANRLVLEEGPPDFWRQRSSRMPHLSALAREVLAVVAAPSCPERPHSVGEHVVSERRASPTAATAGLPVVLRPGNRHVDERGKKRPIKWPYFGEVGDPESTRDLGDWDYDPTAVCDSGDESEDEEESGGGGAAEGGTTQSTDAETTTQSDDVEATGPEATGAESTGADGGPEGAGADAVVELCQHPGGRVRARSRLLDEYVWGRDL